MFHTDRHAGSLILVGLFVLTVASIVCYKRYPQEDVEWKDIKRASAAEPDKPAKLASGAKCSFCGWEMDPVRDKVCPNCGLAYGKTDDWSSGIGEDRPVKRQPGAVKGLRDRLFRSIIIFSVLDVLATGRMKNSMTRAMTGISRWITG